jgi:hypothetical protein
MCDSNQEIEFGTRGELMANDLEITLLLYVRVLLMKVSSYFYVTKWFTL